MEDEEELRLPLIAPKGCGGGSGACASKAVVVVAAAAAPAGVQGTATLFQTLVNFLNIFMGSGMQSMPYALMRGGWLALAALACIVPLFALSGQLIVWAFALLPAATPRTYPHLGRAAAGTAGFAAVVLFSYLELVGCAGPLSSQQLAPLLAAILQLPLLFTGLRTLSRLAVAGLTSSALVLCMVLSLPVLDPHRQAMPKQPPPSHHLVSTGIIQAIGIFSLSSTAHSTLPALRSAMQQPARFPLALSLGFGAMFAAYSSLAAAGYWYWGDSATALATNDLATNSVYTHARLPVHETLAGFVLVNCLSKVPGYLAVLQDMTLSVLPHNRTAAATGGVIRPLAPHLSHAMRLAFFVGATALALCLRDVLGIALSLLGGLASISCSLLLPAVFYAALAWRRIGWGARAGLVGMLVLAVALVALIVERNLCDLVMHCKATRPNLNLHATGGAATALHLRPWLA